MQTCLDNIDPLLGFIWVYIIFLFLLKNINCGYSQELPQRGSSNEYPQSIEQKYEKYQSFLSENLEVKFSVPVCLNRRVFVMF